MRKGTIITLNGVQYPVSGLTVMQSLDEDTLRLGANPPTQTMQRLRRVALSLKNGEAWIPDPKSSPDEQTNRRTGQIAAKDLTVEQIVEAISDPYFVDNMGEWYQAEIDINNLNKPAVKPREGSNVEGEEKAAN